MNNRFRADCLSDRTGMVFQDKCQHVVASFCLVSSANKVSFKENWVFHLAQSSIILESFIFKNTNLAAAKTREKKRREQSKLQKAELIRCTCCSRGGSLLHFNYTWNRWETPTDAAADKLKTADRVARKATPSVFFHLSSLNLSIR